MNFIGRSESKSDVPKSEVREQRVGGSGCQNIGSRLKRRGELERAHCTKNRRLKKEI
jgi:hypothetical protein